jgi:hypothetical protein
MAWQVHLQALHMCEFVLSMTPLSAPIAGSLHWPYTCERQLTRGDLSIRALSNCHLLRPAHPPTRLLAVACQPPESDSDRGANR